MNAKFEGAPGDGDITEDVCDDAIAGLSILREFLQIFFPEADPAIAAGTSELENPVKMGCADAEEFHKAGSAIAKVPQAAHN